MDELEPYDPKYFDYRRHYSRQQTCQQVTGSSDSDGRKKNNVGKLSNLDTLLKLDVMATADETTLEARSLIQQWMDGGRYEPANFDLSCIVTRDFEPETNEKSIIMREARRIVGEVAISDTAVPACRDLGLGMAVRRKHQRKTKNAPIKVTSDTEAVRLHKISNPKCNPRIERTKQTILEQVLTVELREELNHIAPAVEPPEIPIVGQIRSPSVSVDHTKSSLSLEQRNKSESAYRHSDILYRRSCLRLQQKIFEGWVIWAVAERSKVKNFISKREFHCCTGHFFRWKRLTKGKLAKRQLHVEMELVKVEARNTIKADLHYQISLKSKWLAEWRRSIQSEKLEREVREQARKRQQGIQSYLKRLEEKFVSELRKPISANEVTNGPEQNIPAETDPMPESKGPADQEASSTQNEPHRKNITCKYAKKPRRTIPTDVVFLQNYQKREEERKIRREKAALARQELEKQKELAKKREIEAQLEKEMLEKALLKKEKERIEEETKRLLELKQIQRERESELRAKACRSNIIRIMQHYGLSPWLTFVQSMKQDFRSAVHRDQRRLKINALRVWKSECKRKEQARLSVADKMHNHFILLTMWNRLKAIRSGLQVRIQMAEHLYRSKMVKDIFWTYKSITKTHINERTAKEQLQNSKADLAAKKLVPKRFLRLWREYAQLQKEERWRNYRMERMREVAKVYHYELECTAFERVGIDKAFSRYWTLYIR
jgi:hypothetical protein